MSTQERPLHIGGGPPAYPTQGGTGMKRPQDQTDVSSSIGIQVTRGLTGMDRHQFGLLFGVAEKAVGDWEGGPIRVQLGIWEIEMMETIREASETCGFRLRMCAAIEYGPRAGLACLFRCREEALTPIPEFDEVDLLALSLMMPPNPSSYRVPDPYARPAFERLETLGLAKSSNVSTIGNECMGWQRTMEGEATLADARRKLNHDA